MNYGGKIEEKAGVLNWPTTTRLLAVAQKHVCTTTREKVAQPHLKIYSLRVLSLSSGTKTSREILAGMNVYFHDREKKNDMI